MYTLRVLIISGMKMFVRNRQAIFFTLFTPLIIMTIFGFLAFDRVPKISVGVAVNAPPTARTSQFIEQLKGIEVFDVHVGAESAERTAIAEGERSVVFLVPADLFPEGQVTLGQIKQVRALSNPGQQQQASTAISIMNQILDKTTINIAQAPTLFEVKAEDVDSRNLKYIDFLLPGVVALSIMQMSVFSVAFVFADYKEKGILKRLLATPMRPYQFVTSNVITRLVIAFAQAAILITVGVLLFNAHVFGSYWLIALIVLLGAIMFLGLGFTISGFANTVEAVPALANLIVFPMLFLGGTFFPLDAMPDWLKSIAQYLPLTYLSESLRTVMIDKAGFADVEKDLLWMAGWAVALVLAANFTFGFEEKRVK